MAEYRCPKHDVIFDTTTDSRKPGAGASGKLPAHPASGHPDCPLCQRDRSQPTASATSASQPGVRRVIAQG